MGPVRACGGVCACLASWRPPCDLQGSSPPRGMEAGVGLTRWSRGARTAMIDRMGRRILIVDDHARFRASARRILEAHGFDVVGEAEDGSSAVTMAHDLQPEVVLLDLQLPDTDGFEVCARLCE